MSDDQMQGLRSVFDRVEQLDDTTELVRPSSGRGLSGLSALAREAPVEPPRVDAETEPTPVVALPVDEPVAEEVPSPRRPSEVELRRKTSFSLPDQLHDRLSTAYTRDRWTIAALIDLALQRVDARRIGASDIERSVRELSGQGASAIKSLKLTDRELAKLDQLAERMRLSRSQLMCALVSLTLDTL